MVNSTGHLAILGDVNPGAIVAAVGDIIIWGKLKGEAQAGIKWRQDQNNLRVRNDSIKAQYCRYFLAGE